MINKIKNFWFKFHERKALTHPAVQEAFAKEEIRQSYKKFINGL